MGTIYLRIDDRVHERLKYISAAANLSLTKTVESILSAALMPTPSPLAAAVQEVIARNTKTARGKR